ncbi:MAG: anthranilate synthase component I family protein [Bacteroidia bacterium]|nr:anthranilate synthase component I family protein [Bacteroidia bacterium]
MIPSLTFRCTESSVTPCTDVQEFLARSQAAAGGGYEVVLASGGAHDLSVHSMAMLRPVVLFTAKAMQCRLQIGLQVTHFEAHPFDVLQELASLLPAAPHAWKDAPLLGGYVAYEAAVLLDDMRVHAHDELSLPDLLFLLPSRTLVYEHAGGTIESRRFIWCDDEGKRIDEIPFVPDTPLHDTSVTFADWTERAYLHKAETVRKHIHDGDVYQVNLAQRFHIRLTGDARTLWKKLVEANPSPFAAWIHAPEHDILCTSMERFFFLDDGRIETRPIKGTRPRGATPEEDEALAQDLVSNPKDDAELSMIVDLERNDLGRICATGSVKVTAHKRLERYANVQHLVSVVEGRLTPGTRVGEVFRALFPGGSITGCPKIRAMEIVAELESSTRHVYTGAIGYIAAGGRCDFNIAIRTAILRHGVCHLSLGGGIVYDSDPEAEYLETLHKGGTFFKFLGIDISRTLDDRCEE